MNKKIKGCIFCLLCLTAAARGVCEEQKVRPPKKIEYGGKTFIYNQAWQEEETSLETNLDEDPENEIILAFVSTYKEEKGRTEKEKSPLILAAAAGLEEPPYIEHHAFYQIYDTDAGGHFYLAKTVAGMDSMGKVSLVKLEDGAPPAIAFLSPGGERYRDLTLYRWQEGGFRLLFNQGSSCDIEIKQGPPSEIRIGKKATGATGTTCASQDVFRWDNALKKFRSSD